MARKRNCPYGVECLGFGRADKSVPLAPTAFLKAGVTPAGFSFLHRHLRAVRTSGIGGGTDVRLRKKAKEPEQPTDGEGSIIDNNEM
jgi:hypothetical protein